jgi:lysophospholipase L1-like esterase
MGLIRCLALLATIMSARAADSAGAPAPRPDGEWMGMHQGLVARAREGGIELLFIGDSITELYSDNEVWRARYAPLKAANFGLPGDTTESLLWRAVNGELDGLNPKVVVLEIGTNNLGHGETPEAAALGVAAVVNLLRRKLPKSKVLLLGIFPRADAGGRFRPEVKPTNVLLARLDGKDGVRYLDVGPALLERDGSISPDVMADSLHPTVKGYRLWADAMDPLLRKMLKAAAAEPASRP